MHKKNAIEFVTLLGFSFFGGGLGICCCVNHERCSVSGVAFLSLSFCLTLINVCTTRVDITFSNFETFPLSKQRGGKQQMRQLFFLKKALP